MSTYSAASITRTVIVSILAAVVSACTSVPGNQGADRLVRDANPSYTPTTKDSASAKSTSAPGSFAQVDLAKLLYESINESAARTGAQTWPSDRYTKDDLTHTNIERARKFFYDTCPSSERCANLRNRVQDRLFSASVQSCSNYKEYLRNSFTSTNFQLGALTTALAGVGAIFTNASATRLFSGGATIASGTRAEYNHVLFSAFTLDLVFDGVDLARSEFKETLIRNRRAAARDFLEYTLDAAISDAVQYHDMCSIPIGVRRASAAIRNESDPGLSRLNQLLQRSGMSTNVTLGAASVDIDSVRLSALECPNLTAATQGAKQAMTDASKLVAQASVSSGSNTQQITLTASIVTSKIDSVTTLVADVSAQNDKYCAGTTVPAVLSASAADKAVADAVAKYSAESDLEKRPGLATRFKAAQQDADYIRFSLRRVIDQLNRAVSDLVLATSDLKQVLRTDQ